MMSRYEVRCEVEMNPIDMSVMWGVYDMSPENTGIHSDSNGNLIVLTYSKKAAEEIAMILQLDEDTHEYIISK